MDSNIKVKKESQLPYEQLRYLSAYLQEAREEERKSIAREIHDELGQALTTIKLDLSLLNEEVINDATAATQRVQSLKEKIDETIQVVKRIITKLRPGLLDDLGLAAAIEWQANEFQNRTGIVCEFKSDLDDINANPEITTSMFRIFQEALTNILRHSGATRVSIELSKRNNFLELEVTDNGRGITDNEINGSHSFGIIGMRERAEYWQGIVEIYGKQNCGTTIKIRFPIE